MTKWPMVPLGDVVQKSTDWINIDQSESYREVTVRLWGKGVLLRKSVAGVEIAAASRLRVHSGEFIISRIDARNGASGIIPDELEGAVVSNDFPVFTTVATRLLPAFLGWYSKTKGFVELCSAASEGTTNRVRLKEDRFLSQQIPLPTLREQQRLVEYLDTLTAKIDDANSKTTDIEKDSNDLLLSAYDQIARNASRHRLGDIAPLVRRPVMVDPFAEYPGVSVRSFGKGTFHNPPLQGSEITWEKPQLVKLGDVLISNIKGWEGAIAVAGAEDDGRYGSHRYLTYVPTPGMITPRFLCFYLLTAEGLHHVGEASPGSADRNRTTSAKGLLEIPVPVPDYQQQLWFDELFTKVEAAKRLQVETATQREALLPALLNQVFSTEE